MILKLILFYLNMYMPLIIQVLTDGSIKLQRSTSIFYTLETLIFASLFFSVEYKKLSEKTNRFVRGQKRKLYVYE